MLAASTTGTGCQLWLRSAAGVLWSPVTTTTSGWSSMTRAISCVEFLDALDLAREVAVLARGIGVLVVEKEKVVVLPVLAQPLDLLRPAAARGQDGHADQAGEAAVHRVDGDRAGAQLIDLGERGHRRPPRDAAQREHVGGMLVGEDRPRRAR